MARDAIDEGKIARLMEMMEANIEAEIAGERIVDIYIPGAPRPKRPDRQMERALHAQLSIPEMVEFDRRRRAKARAFWEQGDQERKWMWGGW
jgi:hypothetical protein